MSFANTTRGNADTPTNAGPGINEPPAAAAAAAATTTAADPDAITPVAEDPDAITSVAHEPEEGPAAETSRPGEGSQPSASGLEESAPAGVAFGKGTKVKGRPASSSAYTKWDSKIRGFYFLFYL